MSDTEDRGTLVFFPDNPTEVHIIAGDYAVCGRPIEGEYRTGNSPGPIPLCQACANHNPNASNRELVETIGDIVPGFEAAAGESPPAYLNREQLVALREWVIEHGADPGGREGES